jgi:magnesium chelatase family protein
MLAKTHSVALVGADATLVDVEVHVAGGGLPTFRLVGLAAASVREAEQRTRAAITSCGETWPSRKITANLAPGGVRKEGTHFDLPMALGILAGNERVSADAMSGWVMVGELALDGRLRSVRGVLAAAIIAMQHRCKGVICPISNAAEAAIVAGLKVIPVRDLKQAMKFLDGSWEPGRISPAQKTDPSEPLDLSEVRGHGRPKRALEVAAAGGHNLLMKGSPGSGKTMLAQRLPGLLPAMSFEESLDVTRIHSIAGVLGEHASLVDNRPFRSPHHNISTAGLVGGGTGLAKPGEISLAHHGVLFLDELPLYRRDVLDALRSPIEEGVVRIARSAGVVTLPCRFSLIGAMNPCPCGYAQDQKKACRCSVLQLLNYGHRVSGPLLDRFDMQVWMPRVTKAELLGGATGDTSAVVRSRIDAARAVQSERYGCPSITNASVARRDLDKVLRLTPAAARELGSTIDHLALTGRGVARVLRLARTIADLRGDEDVGEEDVGEAALLRLDDVQLEVAS